MIWGDQWTCSCGFSNLFLRKRCRGCGRHQVSAVSNETWAEVMDRAEVGQASKKITPDRND